MTAVRKSTYVFEYRITFLGGEKVGKSSLIHQFIEKNFLQRHTPTAEDHLTHVIEHRENMCVCLFVDTAGSDDFPAMRKLSVNKGNAFIVVYSIDDRKSFVRAKKFVDYIISTKQEEERIKIVLVGNKNDLESKRQVTHDEGLHYAASLYQGNVVADFTESSAKDYESVADIIHKLLTLFIPPPPQVEVPVLKERKFERKLSLTKLKVLQRKTSKALIERKLSTSPTKKESFSDSEISKAAESCSPTPQRMLMKKFRKRADSQPVVKTPFADIYGPPPPPLSTPRFMRSVSPVNSISEIGTPTLISHSSSLNRFNLQKARSISVTSNSSVDSGVDGDYGDFSPPLSPRVDSQRLGRRASLPEKFHTFRSSVRRASISEKMKGMFKRKSES